MTSLKLLSWIVGGIAVQVALFLGVAFVRHWKEYSRLRRGGQIAPAAREEHPAGEWAGWRAFSVTRKVMEDAEDSICSFYLAPQDGKPLPPFLPGQFLTFHLDIAGAGEVIRCYSLSDAPDPAHYRVSIKRVPPPAGTDLPGGRSSNYFHDQVHEGAQLQVRAPSGHFHLDRGDAPVVLVGGGIGITPMLSMLNWVLKEQPEREVWLFYGVRHGGEVILRAQLEALAAQHPKFHLRLCFSNPQGAEQAGRDYHHRGRVDVALMRAELPLKPFHFYICGPTPMMESLVPALEEWGVPGERIHFEAFGPASIKRASKTAPVAAAEATRTVTFTRSGRQVQWQASDGSLLELAESHGVKVNSGCRAGGCGACQTTIRSGEVTYRQSPDFDPEPGNCLLCVCTPKSDVTLEA